MTDVPELATRRLLLRGWRESDLPEFAAMNADPEVMAHLGDRLDRAGSDAMLDRVHAHFAAHGFGPWAVEAPGVAAFVGTVGLGVPRFEAHFTPCVEILWRLASQHWGRGYATEAGRAALGFAFGQLGLDEVVAFTVPANRRSRRVMDRLGMTHSPADDFDHPDLPQGDPLCRHVLYRVRRADWKGRAG